MGGGGGGGGVGAQVDYTIVRWGKEVRYANTNV